MTPADFDETLDRWEASELVTFGAGAQPQSGAGTHGHVHASEKAVGGASGALRRHLRSLEFEHGEEGKIPRANTFRPYRLTLDGTLAAVIVLRASEAFNVCEIDVFLTTELPGLAPLEPTRAALLFAFADAVKSSGSLAVQFTRACAPRGLPRHVQAVAAQAGVRLRYADKAALSPDEVRELYLRLCGLPKEAQQRARELATRRFFSIERICQLVTTGVWPAGEATCVLLSCPFSDLVLGAGIDARHRLLAAHALVAAKTAILAGIFERALCYVEPQRRGDEVVERCQYYQIPHVFDPHRLAVVYGRTGVPLRLPGWSARGESPFVIPPQTQITGLLRARGRDEIRVFLRQDLEFAHAVARERQQMVLLIYPSDYLELSEGERVEAERLTSRLGVCLLACPESIAGLEAEAWRRQRVGRTIRQ